MFDVTLFYCKWFLHLMFFMQHKRSMLKMFRILKTPFLVVLWHGRYSFWCCKIITFIWHIFPVRVCIELFLDTVREIMKDFLRYLFRKRSLTTRGWCINGRNCYICRGNWNVYMYGCGIRYSLFFICQESHLLLYNKLLHFISVSDPFEIRAIKVFRFPGEILTPPH